MKKMFILIIALFFLHSLLAQEIEMKLNLFGYNFVQNGEKLKWKELVKATESNIDASLLIKKAKSHNSISTFAAIVGGGLVGIPLGQSTTDRDPNWTFAYIGGGLIAIGIPFSLSAFNNVNKGVDKYNLALKSASSFEFKPKFKIVASGNGFGLSMNF